MHERKEGCYIEAEDVGEKVATINDHMTGPRCMA